MDIELMNCFAAAACVLLQVVFERSTGSEETTFQRLRVKGSALTPQQSSPIHRLSHLIYTITIFISANHGRLRG